MDAVMITDLFPIDPKLAAVIRAEHEFVFAILWKLQRPLVHIGEPLFPLLEVHGHIDLPCRQLPFFHGRHCRELW